MISLAQEVYRPERHKSLDGVTPSSTDVKRMLEQAVEAGEIAARLDSDDYVEFVRTNRARFEI